MKESGMMFATRRKLHEEEGQGLVEYALIILLIAVVVVGVLGVFGTGVNSLYLTIVASY
jgi:pilus assembly protein Flp/PilA